MGGADSKARLLDDEEFLALMEAERAANGHDVDEHTRQRLWKRLERALPEAGAPVPAKPAAPQPLWAGPLAMAALVALAIGSFLWRGPVAGDGGGRVKGVETGTPVRLVAYVMQADGSLAPFTAAPEAGRTLVFKTLAPQDGVVALVMDEGEGTPPALRFLGSEAHAGVEQLLERDGRTYGYLTEATPRTTRRFCALGETTAERLQALLTALPAIFRLLDGEACIDVPPPGKGP